MSWRDDFNRSIRERHRPELARQREFAEARAPLEAEVAQARDEAGRFAAPRPVGGLDQGNRGVAGPPRVDPHAAINAALRLQANVIDDDQYDEMRRG